MQITFQDFLAWEKADRDVIKVKRLYIDITGDIIAGLLLSQIVYWHLPDKNNYSKLRVKKQGQLWLAKGRNDWWEECRITARQFDRALKILINKGLVEKKIFKFNGTPTTHIRLISEKLMEYVNSFLGNKEQKSFLRNREQKQLTNKENKTNRQNTENLDDSTGFNKMVKSTSPIGEVQFNKTLKSTNIDYNIDYKKEKISVCQTDRQTDNHFQSKTTKKQISVSDCNTEGGLNASSKANTSGSVINTQDKNTQNKNNTPGGKNNITPGGVINIRESVCHDRQSNTSNFSQSKANKRKKINKLSLEEEIRKLGATPEQVERARQRMEKYVKATGTVIRHIERYFLSVLKNLIEFERITNAAEKYTQYEKERKRRKKIFEALLMS